MRVRAEEPDVYRVRGKTAGNVAEIEVVRVIAKT